MRLSTFLARLAAAALVIVCCGCGNIGGTGAPSAPPVSPVPVTSGADVPPPGVAVNVVSLLWSGRERALTARDAEALGSIEVGGAKAADESYLTFVECHCEPPKDPHRLIDVVPVVPKQSSDGSFLAQVRTVTPTGNKIWFVVGVRRVAGTWKIGFLSLGWFKPKPPLQRIVGKGGYTLPVTESVERRIRQVASSQVTYARTHDSLTQTLDYGAVVHKVPQVRLADDGVYGVALESGGVLACYVFHQVDHFELPGGHLQQGNEHRQWGPYLAPGTYRSITMDKGTVECKTGSGRQGTTGTGVLSDYTRVLATSGT